MVLYVKHVNTGLNLASWFTNNDFKFIQVTSLSELQEYMLKPSDKSIIIEYIFTDGGEV